MRTTMQTLAALAVFAMAQGAVLLATGLAPRAVEAHAAITDAERTRPGRIHRPEAPTNLRAEGAPGRTHNAVVVSWDAGHDHPERLTYYGNTNSDWIETWLTLYTSPLPTAAGSFNRCLSRTAVAPVGCIRHSVAPGSASYSETVTGLTPETTYYVHVAAADYSDRPAASDGATVMVTTTAGTGTPDPTMPDPVTPDPVAPVRAYIAPFIPGTAKRAFANAFIMVSNPQSVSAPIRLKAYINGNSSAQECATQPDLRPYEIRRFVRSDGTLCVARDEPSDFSVRIRTVEGVQLSGFIVLAADRNRMMIPMEIGSVEPE